MTILGYLHLTEQQVPDTHQDVAEGKAAGTNLVGGLTKSRQKIMSCIK